MKPLGISNGILWCEEKPVYKKVLTYKYVQNSTQRLPLDSIEYRCRFCGKVKTKQDFQHKAHAVAECIGNKSLITKYECDECNDRFARNEESELGKLFQEFRATHSVKGKNGAIKVPGAEFKWSEGNHTFCANINLSTAHYDMIKLQSDKNNNAELILHRDEKVNLRLVYGALGKFALSVVPEQISKELSNGYIILREHSAFPSYDGLLAVSGKLIPDPGISIYESDDSLEAKYLAAIDVFEFKYIIPLDFEKKSLLRLPDVILPVDFANIEKCTIFPFDYSNDAANLPQGTHVTGKLNNWSIDTQK